MSEPFDLSELNLFLGEEHQPEVKMGGHPAAVLVHGFPGTPAEMRPLANLLNQYGWTTRTILLPGFGFQLGSLFSRDYQEWIETAKAAVLDFQQAGRPVLLIGYSMGGTVAIHTAALTQPAGLILLAPFWRIASFKGRVAWQVYKRFTRSFRPFRRVSFQDPNFRAGFDELVPDLDLEAPDTQEALRNLRVPNRIMTQVEKLGQSAGKSTSQLTMPLLILQGIEDNRVPKASTRLLLEALNGPFRYEEIHVGHDLVSDQSKAWSSVSRSVLNFIEHLKCDAPDMFLDII